MPPEVELVPVEGTVQPGYEAVRTAFAENLASGQELGAHFAAYRHGEALVDLWGGRMARDPALPIAQGSLYTIFSATKALVAMCFALLVERSKISYDEPVATYWPAFASHGKGGGLRWASCSRTRPACPPRASPPPSRTTTPTTAWPPRWPGRSPTSGPASGRTTR